MLTKEQLEIRKQGVTGSEIGAVAGLDEHRTPLDVFHIKMGTKPALVENHHIRRGKHLEPAIAAWWAEEVGAEKMVEPGTLVSKRNPLIIATPDRETWVRGEHGGLEIKAPGQYARGWGAPGTDHIPHKTSCQAHWMMHVLDIPKCEVVALIDDNIARYPVSFDGEFFGMLEEAAEKFWKDHILTGIAPEARAGDTDILKHLLPRSTQPKATLSELPKDITTLIESFRQVRAEYRDAEERHEAMVNRIKQALGDREGLLTPWGRIDWKHQKDSRSTDWKAAFAEVRGMVALYASVSGDRAHLLGELEAIERKFTSTKPGQRPFVVRFQEAA